MAPSARPGEPGLVQQVAGPTSHAPGREGGGERPFVGASGAAETPGGAAAGTGFPTGSRVSPRSPPGTSSAPPRWDRPWERAAVPLPESCSWPGKNTAFKENGGVRYGRSSGSFSCPCGMGRLCYLRGFPTGLVSVESGRLRPGRATIIQRREASLRREGSGRFCGLAPETQLLAKTSSLT